MWEKESESEKERKKECEQAQNRILKRPIPIGPLCLKSAMTGTTP